MSDLREQAIKVVSRLRKAGFDAFFVGGCVRDELMGNVPSDYDIATSARVKDIGNIFRKTVPVGAQFGVMLVLEGGFEFEVATFRSDGEYIDGRRPSEVHFSNAEEDVKRRDFTINGLFYDPVEDNVIDYVGGRQDLQNGVIRAIGDPMKRFDEDKLRILRAVRFSARFGYPIEKETKAAIKSFIGKIEQVSMERIRDELVKMITGPSPHAALTLMDELGLLEAVLPEITQMKGVEQPPQYHPEGDVFVHTMIMMKELSFPSKVLGFATLFHDVGKPRTHNPETLRTPMHAPVGASMTEKILRRLRFSNDDIEKIRFCVWNHMNYMHVQNMRIGKLKRLMAQPTFEDEMELHRIDCLSSHGMLDNYEFLKKKKIEFAEEDLKPKPFLSGHDLIKLGLKPGPKFKEILNEAQDLQLEHVFKTRDDALEWLGKEYGQNE